MLAEVGRLVLVMDSWIELDQELRKRLPSGSQGMKRDYPSLAIVMSTCAQVGDVPISDPLLKLNLCRSGCS
ncbi:hypothetical protein SAMN05443245_4196 [Paraburkholderia fungorum]|uniref:Uncharacterized protein n=1 Tax=Paraburkholderia fungorum TaxID=134537 RepID=A0A1H1HQX4_9BURK|nr:hypothetical protein SAMN05443245_4196 [Paraburkholderia fungorum]